MDNDVDMGAETFFLCFLVLPLDIHMCVFHFNSFLCFVLCMHGLWSICLLFQHRLTSQCVAQASFLFIIFLCVTSFFACIN